MELIKGIPITEYCDQCNLTTRERLELFLSVCQAVQHAHQKGIIHRDIKPGNVLVAMQDGQPAPKIIDFGVAKAINQRLTERTLQTGFAQMLGTPLYMSPEQAEMSPLEVDTRADIYSLGVLLYELLTGTTPFEKERLSKATFDELRQIIRTEEPPRPSARISTLAANLATTIAGRRRSDPRKLSRLVRGELDWIVMKALEKDRTRRYESASSLAADIERYLNDEPVEACPPSTTYRLRKFARRNKTVLTTITLVALSLMIGTGVSIWQAAEAVASKEEAVASKEIAEQQRSRAQVSLGKALEAVDKMLTRVGDETLKNVPLMDKVRREVLRDALELCQALLQENIEDPAVRHALGNAYRRMGGVHAMLGDHTAAEEAFQQAIAIIDPLAADFPLKPAYQSDLSISHRSLGEIYGITGRFDKAQAAYNRSLTIAAKLACEDQHIAEYQRALAGYHNAMALLHHDKGALGKAETAYKASLTTWKKLADKHPEVPIYQQNLALSHNNLALLYNGEGQFKKAEAAHQMSLDILIKLANRHPNVPEYQENLANSHNSLGNVFSDTRRYDKAEAAYNRALTIQDKLSARHPEVPKYQETLAGIQNNLGNLCRRTGQFDEAEEAHQASLSIRKKLADQHPDVPDYQRWQYNAASNFVWMVARYPGRSEKDYAEALRLAEMCVEQRPKESDSWQVLG